ncbi:MAG TPA: hypothetical protein VD837_16260 [Terriglobales bacterium]|nr:hypothetical protein [Terriglobales bacterium]
MKAGATSFINITGRLTLLAAVCLSLSMVATAKKPEKARVVDSGSFGIFVNGRRVATEKFQIEQRSDASVATSEFKAEDSSGKMAQKAELQIASNGDLRRYTWRELDPGKAQEIVEPADQFLVEHIIPNPPDKPQDHPFLLPISTMVLDDYFFSHRQILAWRYLAQACGGTSAAGCKMTKTQFGVIIPRQRSSALVTLEYAGKENVTLRGVNRELDRFNLTAEGEQWALYLDENLKVLRISIPAENTEVLRD